MQPSSRPFVLFGGMLQRIANIGLILAVLLALTPLGMRAYGRWAQSHARRQFIAQQPNHSSTPPPAASSTHRAWEPCILRVPSIGAEGVVEPGDGDWKWIMGPAYHTGTPPPGGPGNPVIAAHSNMWSAPFEDLHRVKPGELIEVVTATQKHHYVVEWMKTINAGDTQWLRNTEDACITLYTCTVPYSETRRHVVRGRFIGSEPAN